MRCFLLLFASFLALHSATAEKKMVCYFGSWSVYRPGNGQFQISDIEPSLCTHFIYSFALLNGNKIVSADPWADLSDGGGKDGYRKFTDLRKLNPSAKISIAIGGWNDSQGPKYSNMASSPKSRKEFIESVIAFLKKHNFDGLDVDWEYPTHNGGKPSDRENFVRLIKELRAALDVEGKILSVAVAALEGTAAQAYNVPELSKYVDFINVMCYDFHGSWERKTDHHAALRGLLSVEAAIRFWTSHGCEKEKLIIGIPTYGRAWTVANPKNCAVGAPANGAAKPGPYTREASMLGYNEICEVTSQGGWTVQYDEKAVAAFAFKHNQWVGYDNIKAVTEKAKFIKESGFGGAMIWSLETDDFRGICGPTWPILKSLNAVLRKGQPVPEEKIPTVSVQVEEEIRVMENGSSPKKEKKSGGNSECTQHGNMPDPNSNGYISCVSRADHGFEVYYMPCPENLSFNEEAGVCDWPK